MKTQAKPVVKLVLSHVGDSFGDIYVTRGNATDRYFFAERIGFAPRRFEISRISRTGDLHTVAGRAADARTETYTCSPDAACCSCARGNFRLMQGLDADCIHVKALGELLATGQLPNPLERPDADVQNTELSEQEPECDEYYDPMLDDDFSHLVMMQGYVEL